MNSTPVGATVLIVPMRLISLPATLAFAAPKEAGDAEIRYMTGQGSKVLAPFG